MQSLLNCEFAWRMLFSTYRWQSANDKLDDVEDKPRHVTNEEYGHDGDGHVGQPNVPLSQVFRVDSVTT